MHERLVYLQAAGLQRDEGEEANELGGIYVDSKDLDEPVADPLQMDTN